MVLYPEWKSARFSGKTGNGSKKLKLTLVPSTNLRPWETQKGFTKQASNSESSTSVPTAEPEYALWKPMSQNFFF